VGGEILTQLWRFIVWWKETGRLEEFLLVFGELDEGYGRESKNKITLNRCV
jgi:hypothetical protein